MLSIGEFARLAGVSVRMLRHYDRLGLLRPQRVDPHSGYRWYSTVQLERANQLIALKDLGFTLEQVGRLLDVDLPGEAVAVLLRRRRDELSEQLTADRDRLRSVEARLRAIEKENPMSGFTEGALPELRLVREWVRIEEMNQIGDVMGDMFARVTDLISDAGLSPTGPGVATYTPDGDGLIAAAAEPIGDAPVPDGLESVVVAAEPRALVARYLGPDLGGIQQAWQQLVSEVERRGLVPQGTCREVYLTTPFEDPGAGWVVDLQQPVAAS